jgi:4-hydroxyacetophenone monooxygenase
MRLDPAALKQALPDADMRVLLMVLYHYTADPKWLAPPFTPRRDVKLIADEDAGLSPEIQAEICAAALDILGADTPPAITAPDAPELLTMMRHCLSEKVAEDYAPMMREQMGFHLLGSSIARPSQKPAAPIIIVGAGVAGVALGKLLDDQGLAYIILEKNSDVGGTWWENTYPGAGVDTPNHAYSYSFGKIQRWSRYFSPQSEIQKYISNMADEFDVRAHIQFDTNVDRVDWNEADKRWHLQVTQNGQSQHFTTPILVSAVGQISVPKLPALEGMDAFEGPIFHSSHWPKDLDIQNKKVAIIGTGASSMQIVPAIVDAVDELTVFQRSPQWARPIPRYHDTLTSGAHFLLENVPFYAAWFRFTMFWRYGDGLLPFLKKDPNWPHPERAVNRINDRHRKEMADYIEQKLAGRADLIEKSMPDYPPYGKRILLDNHWYDTIRKPNVTLHNEGVSGFTKTEVIGQNGHRCAPDIVVMATGFEVSKMASRLNITGRKQALDKVWDGDDPQAYLGVCVPDFPNFFMMAGPTTGLGHGGSGMFIAECHAHYITNAISDMLSQDIQILDAKPAAQQHYMDRYNALHADMIWTHPQLNTYYRNSKNRVYSVMPWRMVDYWNMTRKLDLEAFHIG